MGPDKYEINIKIAEHLPVHSGIAYSRAWFGLLYITLGMSWHQVGRTPGLEHALARPGGPGTRKMGLRDCTHVF